jgi:hypothetical protein
MSKNKDTIITNQRSTLKNKEEKAKMQTEERREI